MIFSTHLNSTFFPIMQTAKLTDRMKSRSPLPKDDLGNFMMSCNIILEDVESQMREVSS